MRCVGFWRTRSCARKIWSATTGSCLSRNPDPCKPAAPPTCTNIRTSWYPGSRSLIGFWESLPCVTVPLWPNLADSPSRCSISCWSFRLLHKLEEAACCWDWCFAFWVATFYSQFYFFLGDSFFCSVVVSRYLLCLGVVFSWLSLVGLTLLMKLQIDTKSRWAHHPIISTQYLHLP